MGPKASWQTAPTCRSRYVLRCGSGQNLLSTAPAIFCNAPEADPDSLGQGCLGSNNLLPGCQPEQMTASDLQHAWQMRKAFQDQSFSLVDRTSFAMMERLGISKVISFDDDFVIYRFGPDRRQAFEVVR